MTALTFCRMRRRPALAKLRKLFTAVGYTSLRERTTRALRTLCLQSATLISRKPPASFRDMNEAFLNQKGVCSEWGGGHQESYDTERSTTKEPSAVIREAHSTVAFGATPK